MEVKVDERRLYKYVQPAIPPLPKWALRTLQILILLAVFVFSLVLYGFVLSLLIGQPSYDRTAVGVRAFVSILLIFLSAWTTYEAGKVNDWLEGIILREHLQVSQGVVTRRVIRRSKHYLVLEGYNRRNKLHTYWFKVDAGPY